MADYRRYWKRNHCWLCGMECVPCVDNFGDNYMGCPRCVIIDPTKAKANGLR